MSLSVINQILILPTTLLPLHLSHHLSLRWEVTEWTDCQADCTGLKTREVDCVTDEAGEKVPVSESECPGSPPPSALPCSRSSCSSWSAGAWSGCSVSCGSGVKQRTVTCLTEECQGEKPAETEACHSKCTAVPAVRTAQGWQRVDSQEEDVHTVLIKDQYNDDFDQEEEESATHGDGSENLKNMIGTNPK